MSNQKRDGPTNGLPTGADPGQAPVSQGAHASPYLVPETRRRVDTASLFPR